MIASSEFIQAAEAQSKALGFSPAAIYVPHPIQNCTDDEIRQKANNAFEAILAAIAAQE